jgi:hypothetical protein
MSPIISVVLRQEFDEAAVWLPSTVLEELLLHLAIPLDLLPARLFPVSESHISLKKTTKPHLQFLEAGPLRFLTYAFPWLTVKARTKYNLS